MSRFIQIKDEHSKILGRRFLNSQLSLYIGIFQLVICFWALTQHVYSIIVFDKILFCDFSDNSTLPVSLTGVDAIIFDIGLFHSLWGISGCVAQHLDGGYGRFAWCVSHTLALIVCLPCAFMSRPKPSFMWPLLIQQSAYGIGLLILSLAALPRILPTFMGKLDNAPVGAIVAYVFGTLTNFFLLFVYWHWYWHVEYCWDSVRKVRTSQVIESHNRRSIVGRTNIDPTPSKLLKVVLPNGCSETKTPLITNISEALLLNDDLKLCSTPLSTNYEIKQNGGVAKESTKHACITNALRSPDTTRSYPVTAAHIATLIDKNESHATMRRPSVLDELSPIESSASSLISSNSQYQQRRLLPTISANYTRRNIRSPFMKTQPSTFSLPLSQPINYNRHPVEFSHSNGGLPFSDKELDHMRARSSTRNTSITALPRHDSYNNKKSLSPSITPATKCARTLFGTNQSISISALPYGYNSFKKHAALANVANPGNSDHINNLVISKNCSAITQPAERVTTRNDTPRLHTTMEIA